MRAGRAQLVFGATSQQHAQVENFLFLHDITYICSSMRFFLELFTYLPAIVAFYRARAGL